MLEEVDGNTRDSGFSRAGTTTVNGIVLLLRYQCLKGRLDVWDQILETPCYLAREPGCQFYCGGWVLG